MRALNRYILRHAVGPFLLVTGVLTGVLWLTQSLRFVDEIVNYGMSAKTFGQLSLLLLPKLLAVILPISLFIAVLYAYYRLSVQSEIVVMRGAGLSRRQLAWPGLLLALMVMAVVFSLTLYAMPVAKQTLKAMQDGWQTAYAGMLLQEGAFNNLRPGLTVYVRERASGGELHGVLVYDARDPARPVTMMAERGALLRGPNGPQFLMINGNRQEVDKKAGRLSLLDFDRYSVDLALYAAPQASRRRGSSERFLPELFWPNEPVDRLEYWKLQKEGHRRIMQALFAPALGLLALAAILSGEFDRRGYGRRIALAALLAAVLEGAGIGLVQAGVKQPWLFAVIYLMLIGVSAISLVVLHRHRLPAIPAGPDAGQDVA